MILETLVDIKIKYCIVYLRPKIHSMNFSKCLNVKVKIMILKKREGMVSLALCDYFLCSYDKHNMISFFFFYTVLPFYLEFFFYPFFSQFFMYLTIIMHSIFCVVFRKATQFFSKVPPRPWNTT